MIKAPGGKEKLNLTTTTHCNKVCYTSVMHKTLQQWWQDISYSLKLQKISHSSPSQMIYEVSLAKILKKKYCAIMGHSLSNIHSKQWDAITYCCHTVYPKKYAHGFVVLCFIVVMQSFIMNSHEVFIHIHQGCFAGTGAIVRLPQCQWSKPDGYGKISQCITTTKHSKAKTVCIFLGIYCRWLFLASKF